MTRIERNEYNYIKREVKKYGAHDSFTASIATDAGSEYKKALHELYTEYGLHPCEVGTNIKPFDEGERIIYIHSIENWEECYTKEALELFASKLN